MSHPLAMLIQALNNGTFRTTTMVKKRSGNPSTKENNIKVDI
jgi:hypothetical protein